MGEAMWPEINAIRVTIASFLAGMAVVAFSGASDAADGQPAITPAVKCEVLVGLSFASSTIVIEKAEAVPETPAGTVQVRPHDGKGKAPPPAGRLWLVGLTFLNAAGIERLALPAIYAVFSLMKAPSPNPIRLGDVHDRT